MPVSLHRAVTTPLLFLFVLGDILGAGVYVLIGQVAGKSGGAVWLPLVIALGLAALTAGSYAELATKYPRAGGASHYANQAFGPAIATITGFCMLAGGIVSVAAFARAFGGDYLRQFVTLPIPVVATIFLATLALINIWGIKESLRANVIATFIEVSGLILIICLGAWLIFRGDADLSRLTDVGHPGESAFSAVLAGAVLAYYSFAGFETSVNVAEETTNPRRSYPIALLGALLVAGVLYLLIGIVTSAAIPTDQLSASSGPLLEVVKAAGGVPPWIFGLIALVAVSNGALLTGIMSSRLTFGMARDGLLPAVLAKVLPSRRTPWVAVVATSSLSLVLAFTGDVAGLAETLVLMLAIVFLVVNAAVLVLRRENTEGDHFRIPTVFPWLGIGSCILLLTQISGSVWLRGLILLAVGLLLAGVNLWRAKSA